MEHILSPLVHGFVFGLGEFCFWKSSKLVFRTVFRNILFLSAMKKFSGSGKRPLPENSLRAARGGPQACLTIPRCMIIIAKKGGSVNNSISTNRAPRAKHFDTRRRSGASIFCKDRLSLCRLSVTIGIVPASSTVRSWSTASASGRPTRRYTWTEQILSRSARILSGRTRSRPCSSAARP